MIVDMNNKTTIDMAHVWKQSLVNKVTRKVKVMDPEGNPVSLTYLYPLQNVVLGGILFSACP